MTEVQGKLLNSSQISTFKCHYFFLALASQPSLSLSIHSKSSLACLYFPFPHLYFIE